MYTPEMIAKCCGMTLEQWQRVNTDKEQQRLAAGAIRVQALGLGNQAAELLRKRDLRLKELMA